MYVFEIYGEIRSDKTIIAKAPVVVDTDRLRFGADYRTRTCDPLITNQVLYQLS
jgi:hypothetical protein